MRLELTRTSVHYPLKVARLPIPPPRQKPEAGAKNGTRTRDPDLGKVVLYQLSYFRSSLTVYIACRILRCKVTYFLFPLQIFFYFLFYHNPERITFILISLMLDLPYLKTGHPMNLSENFTLEELVASSTATKLGIKNLPDETQKSNLKKLCTTILQPLRNVFGQPITVTSGFRCAQLNKIVGGSPASQHIKGEAADIVSSDNHRLWLLIREMVIRNEITVGQLIDEQNLSWIHISLPTSTHKNQILHL